MGCVLWSGDASSECDLQLHFCTDMAGCVRRWLGPASWLAFLAWLDDWRLRNMIEMEGVLVVRVALAGL
jgi:hypothetical protein